ncbi:hypothetical protein Brsp02_04310 [Brucella sp. NBRC 113783]
MFTLKQSEFGCPNSMEIIRLTFGDKMYLEGVNHRGRKSA